MPSKNLSSSFDNLWQPRLLLESELTAMQLKHGNNALVIRQKQCEQECKASGTIDNVALINALLFVRAEYSSQKKVLQIEWTNYFTPVFCTKPLKS